jgi:hypothetical protein
MCKITALKKDESISQARHNIDKGIAELDSANDKNQIIIN